MMRPRAFFPNPKAAATAAAALVACLTAFGPFAAAQIARIAPMGTPDPLSDSLTSPLARATSARDPLTSPFGRPADATAPGSDRPNLANMANWAKLANPLANPAPAPADDSHPQNLRSSVISSSSTPGEVSWRTVVPDILSDQKPIWTFPLHVLRGEHLKPTLILAGATAGLVALDPVDEPYFRNSSGFQTFKTGPLRGRNTTILMAVAPAGLYLGGLHWHDSHAEKTALLAAEALADTQILGLGMKYIDGRLHPSDIPPHGDFTHTWFKYGGTAFNPGSFPSGHAISAFAEAAVFSTRYRSHRWVPYVAYATATFVALTRIPDQAHFPSDVFAGAVLGYAVSHFIVLPRGSPDPSR